MTKFNEKVEKVVIVNKQGFKTLMPNLWMAQSYAKGLWKDSVDRIEVTTVYKVEED
jgi:hypothetical protein